MQDKHTNDIFLMLFMLRDDEETKSMATLQESRSTFVTHVTALNNQIQANYESLPHLSSPGDGWYVLSVVSCTALYSRLLQRYTQCIRRPLIHLFQTTSQRSSLPPTVINNFSPVNLDKSTDPFLNRPAIQYFIFLPTHQLC
jgi:hypothetical protein